MAGIHRRSKDGAYSLVLTWVMRMTWTIATSFPYTGIGGQELFRNNLMAEQSYNKKLTNANGALTLNSSGPHQ